MVLVFDVGGTHTRISLSKSGKLGDVLRMDTDISEEGYGRFLGTLKKVSADHTLQAVVGAIPGQLEGDEGVLTLAPNLPDWLGLPILSRLKQIFDCPVYVTNDVELCGLGEAHDGAGITKGVMVYFTISTGVNAVRLIDGNIDETISRFDIGKLLIGSIDGKDESLESLTGGAALARRKGLAPKLIRDPVVWNLEDRALARGLYDVLLTWTPETVVFGGSMMRDIDLVKVKQDLEQLSNESLSIPNLVYAKLGDLAGLHGALTWLRQTKH